MRDF
jgi:uncharacterized oligopeptide transporter (OPT) family protein